MEQAWKEAEKTSEREHVTPYIWNNPEIFKQGNWENDQDLSSYRLTVDEPENFELISQIIKHFKNNLDTLKMDGVINFLEENKNLTEINAKFERNEEYTKSLQEDEAVHDNENLNEEENSNEEEPKQE